MIGSFVVDIGIGVVLVRIVGMFGKRIVVNGGIGIGKIEVEIGEG